MEKDLYKRISRMESVIEKERSELEETLFKAYEVAVKENNEEEASELIRKIRNKRLDISDKEMALDRIGIDTSSINKFISSFVKVFSNEWCVYRQNLRDITKQPGFPMNVSFPESPNYKKDELSIFEDSKK